jgi:DNA-binding GntR family transcriptional regulator
VPSAVADSELDATARAVRTLRDMVMSRRIGPGQQLRQDGLAEELGVSRSPLREALRMLETEGLLAHVPNQGYFVVRLRSTELRQIYLMRRLLETEILRSARRPSASETSALHAEHERIKGFVAEGSPLRVLQANRRFHYAMFALSPLDVVINQVQRLWQMSESYRAAYLWLPATQERIVEEHSAMLVALGRGDIQGLISLADAHRAAAEASVVALLRGEEDSGGD